VLLTTGPRTLRRPTNANAIKRFHWTRTRPSANRILGTVYNVTQPAAQKRSPNASRPWHSIANWPTALPLSGGLIYLGAPPRRTKAI